MGQRHQVYLRVPEKYYNEGNPNNMPEHTIGLHHQWLYGYRAVYSLYSYLKWLLSEPTNKQYLSHDEHGAFMAAYGFDAETGYYARVHKLTNEEAYDPMMGDNNNGITIIDITARKAWKPRYCFMFIGPQETCRVPAPDFKPLSAQEWIEYHYPNDWTKDAITDRFGFVNKNAEVLTEERVAEIFPAMMSSKEAQG